MRVVEGLIEWHGQQKPAKLNAQSGSLTKTRLTKDEGISIFLHIYSTQVVDNYLILQKLQIMTCS